SGSSVSRSPMTSSFTNSLNPAARPRRAYRMASSAVKHPAVFASRKKSSGDRWYSTPSSRVRSRSTRRTATVTTSAPEARIASTICSFDAYFPVPTIKRDRNVRSPITRGASACGLVFDGTACVVMRSATANEVHQLEHVTIHKRPRIELVAVAQDLPVVLHDDQAGVELQLAQQHPECGSGGQLTALTVDHQLQGRGRRLQHRHTR